MSAVDLHGANFDLIVGTWGRGCDRVRPSGSVAGVPAYAEWDSGGRPVRTPVAKQAFAIVDAIGLQDERIAELVS